MKKFIKKIVFFSIPFLVIIILSNIFYSKEEGDLIRIGNIYRDPFYRKSFEYYNNQQVEPYNNLFSEDTNLDKEYDILIIGDSFAKQSQGIISALNDKELKCLLWGNSILKDVDFSNPIQNLISLLNGDVLSRFKIDYIILESVERAFVSRVDSLDNTSALFISDLERYKERTSQKKISDGNLNMKFVKMIPNNFFRENGSCKDKVYSFNLKSSLFSGYRNRTLLSYDEDIDNIEINNREESVRELNEVLCQLSISCQARGVKLIVLPAPDKYDVYFDYIINKDSFPVPKFFSILGDLPKNYIYIDSKSILEKELSKGTKDLYYFDDTHWSPIAASMISNAIGDSINSLPITISK